MAVSFDFDAVMVHEQTRATLPFERVARPLPTDLNGIVLSGDAALRRRLVAAAELGGWTECQAPSSSFDLQTASQGGFQLVVVDLGSSLAGESEGFAAAVNALVGNPDTLLVVFGSADSIEHEQWARCRGAFAHVPGAAAGDSLVSLFAEARVVTERRLASANRRVGFAGSRSSVPCFGR